MKLVFLNSAPYLAGSIISDLKLARLLYNNGFEVAFFSKIKHMIKNFEDLNILDFKILDIFKHIKKSHVVFLTEKEARRLILPIRIVNPKIKIFSIRRALPKSTKISLLIQKLLSDKILCVSKSVANSINSKKTYVIYDFTESVSNPKESVNNEITFGYLGRNDYDKGTDILLNSIKIKKFKLILAGNFENSEFLKYENVSYLGFIYNIEEFFRKIDILILPSRKDAFPRVILEAFSFGIPVIASNVGGIPEIVKENYNGFIFESENVKNLIEKIEMVENNPSMILNMSKNCIKTIEENFLPNHMLKRILPLLSS
ncbi:MAG: glycosyltransferase family 4 protein [candidate division WOR-3 bacterium]|nr:glycosyltransferase family 4 protein [candidate division WOR-3 bacterium]MCX7947051.1 glycosyltransferase family 4 protein [candidate division WOR-3 bacterium]MDW8149908.1 glycosyltransferase family 4 protein [candidate division WOR-3 bacterium]